MEQFLLKVMIALGVGATGGSKAPKVLAPYNTPNLPPTYKLQTQLRGRGVTSYNYNLNTAIVRLDTIDGSSGTGFFIKLPNGKKVIVTAAHVCGNQTVLYSDKGIHEVLISEPQRDTCVLTTYQTVDILKLGKDSVAGDFVSTTGFPLRLPWDEQKGRAGGIGYVFFGLPGGFYGPDESSCPAFTQKHTNIDGSVVCGVGITTITVKMLVRPGNSGGPAMDYWGNVVGIVIATNNMGEGYIVPVSELRIVLERLNVAQ